MGKFHSLIVSMIVCLLLPLVAVSTISKMQQKSQIRSPSVIENDVGFETYSTISVLNANGELTEIDTEEYVLRVVLAEMPVAFETEALKAQSVLARTYALKLAESMRKHVGAAVCTSSDCCQAFFDQDIPMDENTNKVIDAVRATEAMVLKYNGELIEATYFSCSGGKTESAVDVWGQEVPYLISTVSYGEEDSEHYISTVKYSKEDFLSKLAIKTDTIKISNIVRTDGNGVAEITICEKKFTGVQLRKYLGLKSTDFKITIVGDNVFITTKGYGHRVGMSQYGAEAMASDGYSYEQILAHYFPDTQLEKEIQ